MKVNTARFGKLSIDYGRIIRFQKGLKGFEHLKRFFLVGFENKVLWLHAVDDPSVAFMATNPFMFFNDYTFSLKKYTATLLGIKDINDINDVCVLVFLSFCNATNTVRANLREPVIINALNKKAVRIKLEGDQYPISAPLPLDSKVATGLRDIVLKIVQPPFASA